MGYNNGEPILPNSGGVELFAMRPYNVGGRKGMQTVWNGFRGRDYIFYDEIFPLKKLKFGQYEFNVPKEYERYLKRLYGDDVLTTGKFTRNHHGKHKSVENQKLFGELKDPHKLAVPFSQYSE